MYCFNCGNKLDDNSKFCDKCGKKLDQEKVSEDAMKNNLKPKKETDGAKIIMMLGVFLVLFSSFIFGIFSWENLTEVFRFGFFCFECVLFFLTAFILGKVERNLSRLFYIIGLVMIPYVLSLVPYYNFLTGYLASGAGLYTYLAICYLVTSVFYLLINTKFQSKVLDVITLLLLLLSSVCMGMIVKSSFETVNLAIMIFISLLNIVSVFKKDGFYKKLLSIFSSIVMALWTILIIIGFDEGTKIINLIIFLLYLANSYIRLITHKNTAFRGISPFLLSIITNTYLLSVLEGDILYYFAATAPIILYFLSLICSDRMNNIFTIVISYLNLLILIPIALFDYNFIFDLNMVLLVIGSSMMLFSLFLIFINKIKEINIIMPFVLFIFSSCLLNYFVETSMMTYMAVSSLMLLLAYTICKLRNSKYSLAYIITSIVLMFFATFNSFDGATETNYIIAGTLLLMFIFTSALKDELAFSIISYILLNIVLFGIFGENNIYYSMLYISGITLVVSLLFTKFSKLNFKPYILYSEIILFVLMLFSSFNYPIYALLIFAFVFIISYISLIKYFNAAAWRILYMLLGFVALTKIFISIIGSNPIAYILSILIILITLIVLYLLDIEKGVLLIVVSLAILYPYYCILSDFIPNFIELYYLPGVIYDILIVESINFKDKSAKIALLLVPLSLFTYIFVISSTGTSSIIFDVLVALLYIVYGLIRKQNFVMYLGIAFIVIVLIMRLYTIVNSLAIVIALIILGFILISVAVYAQLNKKE